MNLLDFWKFLSQLSFLLVSATTLSYWMKYRNKTRFDIALVFLSFAVSILGQYIQSLFHDTNPWIAYAFALAVIIQPYLLLRVARYFRPLSRWALGLALAGFLGAGILMGLNVPFQAPGAPLSQGVVTVLILYLTIAGGYASFLFVRGAATLPGITGKRLILVSLGSGLLAVLFLAAWGVGSICDSDGRLFRSSVNGGGCGFAESGSGAGAANGFTLMNALSLRIV